jgi:hypothetical protein
LLKEADSKGHRYALDDLGQRFLDGKGVPVDQIEDIR